MEPIIYRGEVVALARYEDVVLSPRLEALGREDPLIRFVFAMALFARAIEDGSAPGPFTEQRAQRYARLILIDDAEFRFLESRGIRDYLIAGHFGVPVEQVEEKRRDLVAPGRDPYEERWWSREPEGSRPKPRLRRHFRRSR